MYDETATPEAKRIPIATALEHIRTSDDLAMRDVRPLSGLMPSEYDEFWSGWQRIEPQRRIELTRMMIGMAEDDVELDFSQAWYWLLEDQVGRVRASAVEGMWEDTSARALQQMLTLVRKDPDADVRTAAALALSRFAYLAAVDELDSDVDALRQALTETLLDRNEPQEVRRRALESAGYFADDETIQKQIERAYVSGEQLMQESALVAMGRSMLDSWLPMIKSEMGSRSPALRYEAARAAGEMSEDARPLLPALVPLVNDRDTEVATAAIWALGQIGGDAARNALQKVRDSGDDTRSQAATDALAELSLDEGVL